MDEVVIEQGKYVNQVILPGTASIYLLFKDVYKSKAVDSDYEITNEEADENEEKFFIDRESKKGLPEAEPE